MTTQRATKQVRKIPAHMIAQARAAAARFQRFTGHKPTSKNIGVLELTRKSDVVCLIGKVEGIIYSTVRDGKPERYIHEFENPRPVFAVSSDGKQIYIVAGRYRFTERGIVG